MFKGTDIDLNLHVFTVGSVEIERLLLLTKYVQNYAGAKSEVIEAILRRARNLD
jgi:hypothetical protein